MLGMQDNRRRQALIFSMWLETGPEGCARRNLYLYWLGRAQPCIYSTVSELL